MALKILRGDGLENLLWDQLVLLYCLLNKPTGTLPHPHLRANSVFWSIDFPWEVSYTRDGKQGENLKLFEKLWEPISKLLEADL